MAVGAELSFVPVSLIISLSVLSLVVLLMVVEEVVASAVLAIVGLDGDDNADILSERSSNFSFVRVY